MKEEILTLDQLKEMKPDTIFRSGTTEVEDYWDTSKKMMIDYVACRGGIHDWAIYYQLTSENWDKETIQKIGDKMHNRASIRKCVPCTDEALEMYRS